MGYGFWKCNPYFLSRKLDSVPFRNVAKPRTGVTDSLLVRTTPLPVPELAPRFAVKIVLIATITALLHSSRCIYTSVFTRLHKISSGQSCVSPRCADVTVSQSLSEKKFRHPPP